MHAQVGAAVSTRGEQRRLWRQRAHCTLASMNALDCSPRSGGYRKWLLRCHQASSGGRGTARLSIEHSGPLGCPIICMRRTTGGGVTSPAGKCLHVAALQAGPQPGEAAFPSLSPPRPCRPRTGYHAAGQSTSRHSRPFIPGSGPIASFHSWGATSLLTVSMGTPLATELTCTYGEVGAGGRQQGEPRAMHRARQGMAAAAAADWRAAPSDRAMAQPQGGGAPAHDPSQSLAWLNRQPPPTHHVWPHSLVPGQAPMPPGHCLLHRRHILSLPAQPASAVREPGQVKLAGRRIKQAAAAAAVRARLSQPRQCASSTPP